MKIWIVTQVVPFAFGQGGNQIIAVYSSEKAANRHAASKTFLRAQCFKIQKKYLKPKMMGIPLGPVIIDELHGKKVKGKVAKGKQQSARS